MRLFPETPPLLKKNPLHVELSAKKKDVFSFVSKFSFSFPPAAGYFRFPAKPQNMNKFLFSVLRRNIIWRFWKTFRWKIERLAPSLLCSGRSGPFSLDRFPVRKCVAMHERLDVYVVRVRVGSVCFAPSTSVRGIMCVKVWTLSAQMCVLYVDGYVNIWVN